MTKLYIQKTSAASENTFQIGSGKSNTTSFQDFMLGKNEKLIEDAKTWQFNKPEIKGKILEIISNPLVFLNTVFSWAQNLAIFLVPIVTIALSFLYFFQKNIMFSTM